MYCLYFILVCELLSTQNITIFYRNKMEEYQKAIIQKNMNILAPMTNLFIYEKLQSKNIPVYFDKTINPTDAKRKMFQDIQKQGDRAFYKLINAMKESGNSTLAKVLEDEDKKYTKTNKPTISSYSFKQKTVSVRKVSTDRTPTNVPSPNLVRTRLISQQNIPKISSRTTGQIERKVASDRKPFVISPTLTGTSAYEVNKNAILKKINQNQAPQPQAVPRLQNIPVGEKQATVMQQLDIKVQSSSKFLDDPDIKANKICPYPMRSIFRGVLLLITNINFGDKPRRGAEVDEKNLVELFKQLGFTIYKYTDLTLKDMKQKIRDFTGKNNKGLRKFDCCFVIVSSHGESGRSSQETMIITSDEKNIDTHWIIKQFDGNNCEALRSKPKVLLFNSCRGQNREKGFSVESNEIDGKPTSKSNIPSQGDILLGYSTIPDYVSNRNIYFGSWYIHYICEAFMKHAHDTDVEHMLKIANIEINNQKTSNNDMQTPMIENRCFRPCFLHPNLIMRNNIPVSLQLRGTVDDRPTWDMCNEQDSRRSMWSGCIG